MPFEEFGGDFIKGDNDYRGRRLMGKMVTFEAFVGAVLFSFDISDALLETAHFSNIENMFVFVHFHSVHIF